jgi:hypothetical protein
MYTRITANTTQHRTAGAPDKAPDTKTAGFLYASMQETVGPAYRQTEKGTNKVAVPYHRKEAKGRQGPGWITGQARHGFFLSPHGKKQASERGGRWTGKQERNHQPRTDPPLEALKKLARAPRSSGL